MSFYLKDPFHLWKQRLNNFLFLLVQSFFFCDVISHDSCITIPEGSKSGYSPKNKDDNGKSTMNEEWRCMFPIENEDFPASQVKRCCGSPSQGPRQAVEIQRKMVDNGMLWFLFQIYLHTNIHMYINIYTYTYAHIICIFYTHGFSNYHSDWCPSIPGTRWLKTLCLTVPFPDGVCRGRFVGCMASWMFFFPFLFSISELLGTKEMVFRA